MREYKDPERWYPVWNIRRYCRVTPQIIFMTLRTVFLFSADCGNATVSTNSKQVDLPHSRGVNMFYFSGLSFRDTQRVWVFRVWVFETFKGLSFSGLSFRDTRGSEFFRGLSFRDTRGSEFFGSEVWVFEVWVFETPVLYPFTVHELHNQNVFLVSSSVRSKQP